MEIGAQVKLKSSVTEKRLLPLLDAVGTVIKAPKPPDTWTTVDFGELGNHKIRSGWLEVEGDDQSKPTIIRLSDTVRVLNSASTKARAKVYVGKLGRVVEVPTYPNTWFTVRILEDDVLVRLQLSSMELVESHLKTADNGEQKGDGDATDAGGSGGNGNGYILEDGIPPDPSKLFAIGDIPFTAVSNVFEPLRPGLLVRYTDVDEQPVYDVVVSATDDELTLRDSRGVYSPDECFVEVGRPLLRCQEYVTYEEPADIRRKPKKGEWWSTRPSGKVLVGRHVRTAEGQRGVIVSSGHGFYSVEVSTHE